MLEGFFQAYLAEYRPFKTYWNYEDGCILRGCRKLYDITGDVRCLDFIMDYLSPRVQEDGSIPTFLESKHCLDSFHCSKALFFADAAEPHGKYARALRRHPGYLRLHPRTAEGLLWHKEMYPHQIWLDGLYMIMPFLAEYAVWSAEDAAACNAELRRAFGFVRQYMREEETGLYRHGADRAMVQSWADPVTGLSASCWLRGMGWLLMALVDCIPLVQQTDGVLCEELKHMLRQAVEDLLPYRNETGLFYHVVDQPEAAENYTETSGNAMIAYTLMQGAALEVLTAEQAQIGLQMLHTLCENKLLQTDSGFALGDICSSAGLGGATNRDGSCGYYCGEPRVQNDPKGVGALMLACAAAGQWQSCTVANHSAGNALGG